MLKHCGLRIADCGIGNGWAFQTRNRKSEIRNGFTIVEIVVAMAILLIAFGLVTVLYTRSSQIRRLISNQNEIQLVLTQMLNTIIYSDRTTTVKALENATTIYGHSFTPVTLPIHNPLISVIFGNTASATVQYYLIAPGLEAGTPDVAGTDTTLWHGESSTGSQPASWKPLELNKNVYLQSGSRFEYYDAQGKPPDATSPETTLVKITFVGKSADPSMRDKVPVTVQTMVRARNKTSF